MVCKRLQRLAEAGYIAMARTSSTEPALYRLASRGKQALIEQTALSEADVSIPKQLPRKTQHFTAINDLRFHFEQLDGTHGVQLSFFFSERELCSYYQRQAASDALLLLLARYGIIPDAIARLSIACEGRVREVTAAIEYDAGTEHAAFFGRTKVKQYAVLFEQNYEWLGDFKVFTFAQSVKRIVSLMRQAVHHQPPLHLFYFAAMEKLNQKGWEARGLFLDPYDFFVLVRRASQIEVQDQEFHTGVILKHALVAVPATCSRKVFPRDNTVIEDNSLIIESLPANS
jgi:hypothetical protein